MRLIDSNRLYDIAATKHGMFHVADVDCLPVIDAVPVVRCKDCLWRKKNTFCLKLNRYAKDEHFCAYGESLEARRAGDTHE